ncbi:MAG: sulfurtransferase-like selenium metabolism protein YedF, partial [Candidatus Eremiobacteraeota bacterium]|nr:sulfurtransferase-like selenium metabolism protein YedF [Candidatus Eremiobacteraeota bacterium]
TKPRAIVLINNAVELSIEGSPVISELTVLSEQGVHVYSCLSSLDELQAEEKIAVGSQADMAQICEVLLTAWKVVSL